jgi:hypothetical protein
MLINVALDGNPILVRHEAGVRSELRVRVSKGPKALQCWQGESGDQPELQCSQPNDYFSLNGDLIDC